jgi:hypothetical protein
MFADIPRWMHTIILEFLWPLLAPYWSEVPRTIISISGNNVWHANMRVVRSNPSVLQHPAPVSPVFLVVGADGMIKPI